MNNKQLNLTSVEMRSLMFEALAYEGDDEYIGKENFKKYDYQGFQSDLFRLTEKIAIKKGLINRGIKIRDFKWCIDMSSYKEYYNTNFSRKNIMKMYEEFHLLLNKGIISPGSYIFYGQNLPYMHVTDYGLKCIEERDVLPYDQDGYLKRLKEIEGLDKWIEFYIRQALKCFNVECLEATQIMLGLASERLTLELIDSFKEYLQNTSDNSNEIDKFNKSIDRAKTIANKYEKYLKKLEEIKDRDEYIKKLNPKLDYSARNTYFQYTRITRNELSHPNEVVKDRIEVLMHFIGFVKYCELQYLFINYFKKRKKSI